MLTQDELQNKLNILANRMVKKGLIKPNARFTMVGNATPSIILTWEKKDLGREYVSDNHEYKHLSGDTMFDDAAAFITALPDKATREQQQFLELLAETIEYGAKVGIEDGFVNPLRLMAQKLSENVIEGPKS